jgi:aminoglycoside phosphotransferase (APT) family kinase protein
MYSESTVTIREYSKRLGNISDEQLQHALSYFELGEFLHAEPISFGLFGQNLFVTSTAGEFVLRGVPHYDWQFPTEKFFIELLQAKTHVPVPYPYCFNPSPEIFGWPFVIMPKMPGLQLADSQVVARLSMDERRGVARALAAMLIEIQTLTWEFSGRYNPATQMIEPMQQDYRGWIVQRIRELITQAQSYNDNTTAGDAEWVELVIDQTGNACLTPYQPCVVLEDYKEPNVVVIKEGTGWQVSGVFDFMTAHFGDGEADLARQVGTYLRETPELADEFVRFYLDHKVVQSGFCKRQQLYMLYDSLLIWSFWQGHAGGLPENKSLSLEQWAGPFVAHWEKF